MGLTTTESLRLVMLSLGVKKGMCLDLLEELRTQNGEIISIDFIKKKKIRAETLKKYQDPLEELDLIEVEVLRNKKGRPNKITLTNKGEIFIEKLLDIQNTIDKPLSDFDKTLKS